MLAASQRLDHQIEQVQARLNDLPDGRLICSHNQGYCKWYQSNGSAKTYIPRKKRFLAEQLAEKRYLSLLLAELLDEKKAIESYLNYPRSHFQKAELLLSADSEYRELLSGFFHPSDQESTEWMNSPYQRNLTYPEQLIHKSISGNLVRSKSESMIDMFLYIHKVPFRYECALQLGDYTLFPDFTIRHPKTNHIYYWEHFGLMDHPQYAQKAYAKLQLYTTHGIIPSIHLITTYETKENPLDPELVKEIIQYHFL